MEKAFNWSVIPVIPDESIFSFELCEALFLNYSSPFYPLVRCIITQMGEPYFVASRDPFISLIICTRNRKKQLTACLKTLSRIDFPCSRWELILVDNGSSDQTSEVIATYKNALQNVKSCFEPIRGLARARNRGLSLASGDIIAFTDDDCYPEPNFLAQIALGFMDEAIDFVAGRVELYSKEDAEITALTLKNQVNFDPGIFIPTGAIHGANFAIRRRVMERIGGFDELLGSGTLFSSGEDIEFVARASAAGFRGVYLPGPCVLHHHGRKTFEVPDLMKKYDWGRGAYYARHFFNKGYGKALMKFWLLSLLRDLHAGKIGRPSREILAAILYSLQRLLHRHSVPHFDK